MNTNIPKTTTVPTSKPIEAVIVRTTGLVSPLGETRSGWRNAALYKVTRWNRKYLE